MPAQTTQAFTTDRSVPSRMFELGNQPPLAGRTDALHSRNKHADGTSASHRLAALRRTLTAPWQAVNAQLNLLSGVDRSAHVLGTARARASAADASNISAVGRRKSTLSVASQRSLYTVDGLPEDATQTEMPILSGYSACKSIASGDVSGSAGGGSAHPTSAHTANASASLGQQVLCAQMVPSASIPQRAGQQTMNGYPYFLPPPPPAPAATSGGEFQLPPVTTPSQPYQPQPQAQAHHTAPTGDPSLPSPAAASAATGLGLMGVMHGLLGRIDVSSNGDASGGGAITRVRQGAHSGEPLLRVTPSGSILTGTADPAVHGGATAEMASAARVAPSVGCGGNAPSRQQPAVLQPGPWDDPRNPMSLCYDPSLDQSTSWPPDCAAAATLAPSLAGSPPQPPPDPSPSKQALAGGPQPPYKPHCTQPRGDAPPPPPPGIMHYAVAASAPAANVAEAAAPADADVRFALLDLKETCESPSVAATTAAAAAAAYASGASASPAAPDAAAAAAGMQLTLRGRMASYFGKWRGVGDTLMPAEQPVDIWWSWLGAFLSILVVAVLQQYLSPHVSLPLMIASFGASAVLLFGVPASKLAQPRNFLGGQLVSAVVGVLVRLAFMHTPHLVWLSAALGMSLALAAMQLTRTVHPPGGASALIAASAVNIGPWYGFKFILTVFFGCVAMLAVSLLINNLSSRRRYPTYWLGK